MKKKRKKTLNNLELMMLLTEKEKKFADEIGTLVAENHISYNQMKYTFKIMLKMIKNMPFYSSENDE